MFQGRNGGGHKRTSRLLMALAFIFSLLLSAHPPRDTVEPQGEYSGVYEIKSFVLGIGPMKRAKQRKH